MFSKIKTPVEIMDNKQAETNYVHKQEVKMTGNFLKQKKSNSLKIKDLKYKKEILLSYQYL